MEYLKEIATSLILFGLASCANYKVHVDKALHDWKQIYDVTRTDAKPEYVLYLVGDAGYRPYGEKSPALDLLKTMLDEEGKDAGVIFLGDNIYPAGLPDKSDTTARRNAELNLLQQIESLEKFKGDVYFIPGNHDWYADGGVEGLKRQEKFIEKKLGKGSFAPENGCPAEVVDLSDNTGLILIDSEWYLQNWERTSDFNEDCPYRTRAAFLSELRETLKDYKYKRVIIALHHPFHSNGPHGGKYSLRSTIFPYLFIGTFLKNAAGM